MRWVGIGLMCVACAAPPGAQIAADHDFAVARTAGASAAVDPFELERTPEALRLLQVRATGGFWAKHQRIAVFWSDGTIEIEAIPRDPMDHTTCRTTRRLTSEQLRRLNDEMPALGLCFDDPKPCVREDATDHGSVYFLVHSGELSSETIEHYGGSRHTPHEFLEYETFVLGLIEAPCPSTSRAL